MKFWQVVSFTEPEQLLDVAREVEDAGFHGILLSDHLFFPEKLASRYPYSPDGRPGFEATTPFPDPWATIAALAARTTRLRFATMVYILPLRHPLEVAKTVGTVALLSGGRVALGCGAGWIREEYDALGVDFATRGRRFDEMIGVLRALWESGAVEHHGRFFDLPRLSMSPAPGTSIPIWVGGLAPAALPFETIVPLAAPPDPDVLRRLEEEHGMTATTAWPFTYTIGARSTLQAKRAWLRRFADQVIAKVG